MNGKAIVVVARSFDDDDDDVVVASFDWWGRCRLLPLER